MKFKECSLIISFSNGNLWRCRILNTFLTHIPGYIESHEFSIGSSDDALTPLVEQQHILIVRSIDATRIKDVSLLDQEPRFIVEIHENAACLICHQTLGDRIFFCLKTGILVHDDKDEFNIVFFFYELIDFVRCRFCPSNQAICFLEGDTERIFLRTELLNKFL